MLEFFTLFSGSSGNASFITDGTTSILIDAGVSCKRICDALAALCINKKPDALLITHEHSDHIKGVDVLCRRKGFDFYANEATIDGMALNGNAMKHAHLFETGATRSFGAITVTSFSTPHDTPDPVGFVFRDERTGKTLGYASDIGHISQEAQKHLTGCDALYIESNHDLDMLFSGRYPYSLKRRVAAKSGHLSNDDCAGFLTTTCAQGTRNVMLGHLSCENNTPRLAFNTSRIALESAGAVVGGDVILNVSPRESCSRVMRL